MLNQWFLTLHHLCTEHRVINKESLSTFSRRFARTSPPFRLHTVRLPRTCRALTWTKCQCECPWSARNWTATGLTCIRASPLCLPTVWHAPWHRALRAERVTELAPDWTRSRLLFDLMVRHFFFFKNRIIPLSLAAAPSPSLSQTLAVCLTFSSGSTRRGCLRYKSMANEAAGPDASWLFHLPACFKGRMEKESGTTYSI